MIWAPAFPRDPRCGAGPRGCVARYAPVTAAPASPAGPRARFPCARSCFATVPAPVARWRVRSSCEIPPAQDRWRTWRRDAPGSGPYRPLPWRAIASNEAARRRPHTTQAQPRGRRAWEQGGSSTACPAPDRAASAPADWDRSPTLPRLSCRQKCRAWWRPSSTARWRPSRWILCRGRTPDW